MIRGLIAVVVVATYMLAGSLAGYVLARLFRSPGLLYSMARFGGRLALWLTGIRIEVLGAERLRDLRNSVVMANHESLVDAVIMALILPVDFKAVVKKELFRFPFFGSCLRYAGFIEVDRKDRRQAVEAMGKAVDALRAGACFLIFPEGTRTRTGELGPFKKGAFVVACDAGSRIVPIALLGVRRVMPRGGLQVTPGTVKAVVLEPVSAAGFAYDDRERLAAEVRGRIQAELLQQGEA